MAFDKTPTTWLPGYTSNGTSITIPLTALPSLSSGDANASSGDIRAIALAINEALYQFYNNAAQADKPKSMTLNRNTQSNDQSNYATRNYSAQIKVTTPTVVVAPETTN